MRPGSAACASTRQRPIPGRDPAAESHPRNAGLGPGFLTCGAPRYWQPALLPRTSDLVSLTCFDAASQPLDPQPSWTRGLL